MELGMQTLSAGYEFAHRDDYEGRKVLPSIKVDADSRNIEELEVEPDPDRYNPRKTPEELAALAAKGSPSRLRGHDARDARRHPGHRRHQPVRNRSDDRDVPAGHLLRRDQGEVRDPENGIPMKQLHSYDYGGPYAGFKGAINFYREIDRMVNSRVWGYPQSALADQPRTGRHAYAWE
jgi:nitrogenase molybdenum-iron protein alpha chain